MKRTKIDGWYSRKTYPHFDNPLPFEEAKALVSDPETISQHAFLPFIGFTDTQRRFRPKEAAKYKNKERELRYCSHRDGYIHAFYAKRLQEAYETFLSAAPFERSVLGYRAGLGTNIHMAAHAFDEICARSLCGDCL